MPSARASSGPRSHESSGVVRTRAATKSSLWSRNGPGSDTIPHENLPMTAPARMVPLPASDGSGSAIGRALPFAHGQRPQAQGRPGRRPRRAAPGARRPTGDKPMGQVGKRPSSPDRSWPSWASPGSSVASLPFFLFKRELADRGGRGVHRRRPVLAARGHGHHRPSRGTPRRLRQQSRPKRSDPDAPRPGRRTGPTECVGGHGGARGRCRPASGVRPTPERRRPRPAWARWRRSAWSPASWG